MKKELLWKELPETLDAGNIVAILPYNGRLIVACERAMFNINPQTDVVTQIKFIPNE